ncbi:hypothetical protein [Lacticaseibacillus absianus]|uniref:hypothetical protein n=1 Tax=Lacticaseibacillus absianus TaxID=2729623 RepID=UPI0015CD6B45|nr:hypothetical protein [Lacticaseibacillus absianus]
MTIILTCLITAYAGTTAWAAIADWRTYPGPSTLSLTAALCLGLGLRWAVLVPVGVVALLLAAICNGIARYGHIHWTHLLVRSVWSLILLGLWWC